MRRLETSKRLEKTLVKLAKKDPNRYEALFKKIEEILAVRDVVRLYDFDHHDRIYRV